MNPVRAITLACMLGIAACAAPPRSSHSQTGAAPGGTAFPGSLPVLFSGVLPCADCPGIRYDLDLRPASVYVLRMTYLERSASFDDIGRWSVRGGRTLVLAGSRESPERFEIDGETLHMLDLQGNRPASGLNYTITRQAQYRPVEPRLKLHGRYRCTPAGGTFEECRTGLKLPVTQNAALEEACSALRGPLDQSAMVSLEGRIEKRPAAQGSTDVLVVEQLGTVQPGGQCEPRAGR